MYICPICGREFEVESHMAKHLLICWKEENPFHKSKEAPHSEDIVISNVSIDINDFFNSLKRV